VAKNSADTVNMFEDLMIGLQDILKRLEMPGGFDDSGSEKNLVNKNIVPSNTSTFNKFPAVKSILNSDEKTRAYNIGYQWARAFFDVQKMNKAAEDTSKPSTVLSKAKETVSTGKLATEKKPENKSSILGIAAGIVGVLAAAYAIWEMFGAEGGFVMKAVSKLPSFLKLLKGTAGKIGTSLLKRIKFIPFIGALAGFVFAFMRFQEGQWFRGTLEIVSAIAGLTGLGLPLSYIIDGALLLYDLSEEKGSETGMVSAAVKGGKYATKAIFSVLKKTATTVGTKLLKVLKFVPFIGGVAGLALSYMRFQDGEWVAGIFEFVSAILDFIPGVGNIASYIIDGGLLLYDLLKTPTDSSATSGSNATKTSRLEFSFSNGMNYITKLIGPKLLKALPYIPVIGNFMAIYEGAKLIMNGNVGSGVRKLIQGMFIFLPPGLSDHLIAGYDWLVSMFTDTSEQPSLNSQPAKPFGVRIKEYIQSKLSKLPAVMQDALRLIGVLSDEAPIEYTEPQSVGVSSEAVKTATTPPASVGKGVSKSTIATAAFMMTPAGLPLGISLLTAKVIGSTSNNTNAQPKEAAPVEAPKKSIHSPESMLSNIKASNTDVKIQTNAILVQNQILMEMISIARQQLDVTKKKSNVIVAPTQGAQANVANFSSESFNTSTQSSRQRYSSSPYTLSNA